MAETAAAARPKAQVSPRTQVDGAETVRAKDPVTIVIFGASGDLAKRKLIPALYQLEKAGHLPEKYVVLGFSRSPMTDDAYRESMLAALKEFVGPEVKAEDKLVQALHYQPGNNDDLDAFRKLKSRVEKLEFEGGLPGNRLFYLSVSPEFFPVIVKSLGTVGLVREASDAAWSRVIIEKPFGRDLASARSLSQVVTSVLDESQIWRIDHYLGKETVQNILSFRFGNSIFEPLFNQKHVENVQITVSETLGMEGKRGAYYDTAGTLRDMAENHMLQLLTLIAMEPPAAMDSQSIRDEKVKVVRALVPMTREEVARNTVRGQYGTGVDEKGVTVKGFRQEEGVRPDSTTETYVALRLHLDNWRWAGVPFYLRSGKRLKKRVSEIAITFRQPPLRLFHPLQKQEEMGDTDPHPNVLVMRIQPNEGISLSFACKVPGMKIVLSEVDMDFFYGQAFRQRSPEAYERLLLDALRGDPSLFTRSDEVEYAWRFVTSILDGWAELPPPKFPNYYPFTDGPDEANRLMEGTKGAWRRLEQM